MFDSHDDDLWEVPSIDADVPVRAAVSAEEAVTVMSALEPVETTAPPYPAGDFSGAYRGSASALPLCAGWDGCGADGTDCAC